MARNVQTMSFLTSSADVLNQPTALPDSTTLFKCLVDAAGESYELNPAFGGTLADVLRALHAGKVVHIDADEEVVSAERAAELLGVSRPTVYAWQDRGLLAREGQSAKRMVPLADINRYQRERVDRAEWRDRVRAAETADDAERADQAASTFDGTIDLTKKTAETPRRPHRRKNR